MAVVRTCNLRLKNGEDFKQVVRYSSRKGGFEISMPSEYNAIYHDGPAEGKTEKEAQKDFDSKMEKWNSDETKERKVLIFSLSVNGTLYEKPEALPSDEDAERESKVVFTSRDLEVENFHHGWGERDQQADPDLALGLIWRVGFERTIGKTVHYYRKAIWSDGKEFEDRLFPQGTTEGDFRVIEWSKEREDYFRRLESNLQRLVEGALQFREDVKTEKGLDLKIKNGESILKLKA